MKKKTLKSGKQTGTCMHLIKLTITLTIKKSSNPEDAANTDRFGCVSTPTQKLADLLMPPKIFNSALLIIPI